MTDIVSCRFSGTKQIKCFSAYFYPTTLEKTFFVDKICLSPKGGYEQLNDFISKNKINLIVNQQIYSVHKIIKNLRRHNQFKYVFFQHDRPIVDVKASLAYYFYAAFHGSSLKRRIIMFFKLLFSPLYICLRKLYYYIMFRDIYSNVDRLILLSEKFIPTLLNTMAKTDYDSSLISFVNNSITFLCSLINHF